MEVAKLLLSFWEKLVVLDAATLAASFTASGVFREHLQGDGGVGYLNAAWKLLSLGIALCLLAQLLQINAIAHTSAHMASMRILNLLNRSAELDQTSGKRIDQHRLHLGREIVSAHPAKQKKTTLFNRLAGYASAVGLLSSIAAFYWLYKFAHANVTNLHVIVR